MEIPLFPLPNVVLFPNVVLPLHIFEDRYKQMINACIDSGDVFGVVLLREGAQEETEQTIHRAGTTARVMEVERLDGGRMNVLCQGERRFRVSRFTQRAPFWKAAVNPMDDEEGDPEILKALAEDVSSLYRRAFEIGIKLHTVAPSDLHLPENPFDLSVMVSYVLDIDSEEKEKLLEMTSTEKRLQALVGFVDDAIRKLEQQLVYRKLVNKVRGNGDLGKPGGTS